MPNTKANITEIGPILTPDSVGIYNGNWLNLQQKDYDNYAELNQFIENHKTSTDHPSENITYSGLIADANNAKLALDILKAQLDNLDLTGSTHDPYVTSALIDVESEDFGVNGSQTYLNGRLNKWENRIIAAENQNGDMLKSTYDTDGDGIVNQADSIVESPEKRTVTDTEKAIWNGKAAQSEVDTLSGQMADLANYNFQMFDKDANGIYTRFEEYRDDATLFRKTVLSNPDVNGNYQTETQTKYDTDGITILETNEYALTYDVDNELIQRTEVIA